MKPGDRVVLIRESNLISEGATGTYWGVHPSLLSFAVEFGNFPPHVAPHNCYGLIRSGRGRWINTDAVALFPMGEFELAIREYVRRELS